MKMKGLELCEKYYFEYGEPMLKAEFPELLGLLAVGLVGSGSECFGYDDELSRDHDFEPGFCIFLPDEEKLDRKAAFELERAYSRLPKSFMGFHRNSDSPVGGSRHGVIRTADFFADKTGDPAGRLDLRDWFFVSEQSLAEATNGKVFFDGYGEFSNVRASLSYMPTDVRLKKLAGNLLIMGQAGQYNYPRCIKRGDTAAAQLAVIEFAKSAQNAVFLLNKCYVPYYKWSFRAMREQKKLSELCSPLEYLISSPNGEKDAKKKVETVENVCEIIAKAARDEGLVGSLGNYVELCAYEVNNRIENEYVRNLHILYAV